MDLRKMQKVICILCSLIIFKSDAQDLNLTFPDGFLIGTATSSYQVEGAWNEDGKSENVWDHYVHEFPDRIADKSNGDVSTDFYHKYKEDIQLVKDIGFNHFRFSLSWSRIFPTGYTDKPSKSGIQFYHNILDELDKHGIVPFVTIYHWDHPQNLEKIGGWLNESMAYVFADYAKFIFKEFGSRVKYFSTINEPYIYCLNGYGSTVYAPGRNLTGTGQYLCVQNMLKGHALAYHIYDKEFRNAHNGRIGIVIPCFNHYNKYENDTDSADIAFEFQCGWTAQPIFSDTGDYPEIMKKRIAEKSKLEGLSKSRLPTLSAEWIKRIRGTSDYFGLNHYSSFLVEPLPLNDQLNWPNDEGLKYTADDNWPSSQSPWLKVVPEGIRGVLNVIKEKYNNPPLFIMENGVSDGNGTNDNLRINYYYSYMKEVLGAIEQDKCNVKAYTIWSFLDSFEWNQGYSDKFGIVSVDFNDKNRKRTPKKSVNWIKSVLKSRTLQSPNTIDN